MALELDPRGGVFENSPLENGAAAAPTSPGIDEELVQSCRQSRLVSSQKEAFISSAAQVLYLLSSANPKCILNLLYEYEYSKIVNIIRAMQSRHLQASAPLVQKRVRLELDPRGGVFENAPLPSELAAHQKSAANAELLELEMCSGATQAVLEYFGPEPQDEGAPRQPPAMVTRPPRRPP